MHAPRRGGLVFAAVGLVLSAAAAPAVAVPLPSSTSVSAVTSNSSSSPMRVNITLGAPQAHISPNALGLNTAVWDPLLLNPSTPALIQSAGVKLLRFPGGSTADAYHWQTNTVVAGQGYVDPANTFNAFMGVAKRAGAHAIVTVNYGSGTPAEAAAWVREANIVHHDHVRYWEIGNEVYGNGTYGATWEYDQHAAKGPATYAHIAAQYIAAMRAVDPRIKIGVVLTAPGNWPSGIVLPGQTLDWNNTVLSILGRKINFVDVHWYAQSPGSETDAGLLASTGQIPAMVARLRSDINSWSGARAPHVHIMVTETNSVSYNPGKQTTGVVNALFLANDVATWLEQGVKSVSWWDLHNGPVTNGNNAAALVGSTTFGDYGVLSAGVAPEPAANTPFPSYYGLTLMGKLLAHQGKLLATSSTNGLVLAHAAQSPGRLAILVVNSSPTATAHVHVPLPPAGDGATMTIDTYGAATPQISSSTVPAPEGHLALTVAPYTMRLVVVHAASVPTVTQ